MRRRMTPDDRRDELGILIDIAGIVLLMVVLAALITSVPMVP